MFNVPRSSMYYKKVPRKNDGNLVNEIIDIYQEHPYYGYRRIHVTLRQRGFTINHKKVQRLFTETGLKTIYPKKKTSIKNYNHKVFDYLLGKEQIVAPNKAWQIDITYIKLRKGFVYLICLIDVFSRKIMGWILSPFLDTKGCISALENALFYANPEIVNSDQGSQFTSDQWVNFLQQKNIAISMDGKGRWADNVHIERLWRTIKYELVYLSSFDNIIQAKNAIEKYIAFYNQKRPHQSLNYHTPDSIYRQKRIPSKQELFDSFIKQKNQTQEVVMYS